MDKREKRLALDLFNKNLKLSLAGVYYTPANINAFLDDSLKYVCTRRKGNATPTINLPAAFDTETTSTYVNDLKFATLYEWTLGINGLCLIGRTYNELINCLDIISKRLELDGHTKTLTLFTHNLAFDFQFIRKHFEWIDAFARTERKPMYAVTSNGFRFQDSYVLTGYSLQKTAENLTEYPEVNKKVGDLDYSLIRHSSTPLSDVELGYCINDVCVVMADICTRMLQENWDIAKIPMTSTGYARRLCKDACFNGEIPGCLPLDSEHRKIEYNKHKNLMNTLQLTPPELNQAKRAFSGGFTHANAWYVGQVLHNLQSFDFTSSYPASMVAFKYPMSAGRLITDEEANVNFEYYRKHFCCMFDVKFINIKANEAYESYFSVSKCYRKLNVIENNGRVWSADMLATTITDVDFQIVERVYDWDSIEIRNLRIYKRGYLPTNYVKTILYLYEAKTTLKGVPDKEEEYQHAKGILNSLYGMMVTDIAGDTVEINNYTESGWITTKKNISECVDEYNKSRSRFISYLWGVFVTAYSRRNLWTAILECGDDYVYSDTDSIKCLNFEKHKPYFEKYNDWVQRQMKRACEYHHIDFEKTSPKTIKGKSKPLGVWDDEGNLDSFKTLGAKRYMYVQNDHLTVTIAGVHKYKTADYLIKKYKTYDSIYSAFKNDLIIPDTCIIDDEEVEASGKKVHAYIDDEITAEIVDYLGNKMKCTELSSCHLEGTGYNLSLSSDFVWFLQHIAK